jgi:hypothetical protein
MMPTEKPMPALTVRALTRTRMAKATPIQVVASDISDSGNTAMMGFTASAGGAIRATSACARPPA